MRGADIVKEIERYLQDSVYNYAVLIDGEWGSGKTYFVKNELKAAIEKAGEGEKLRKVKYVSLYGCKSIEDIQENLVWELAGDIKKAKNNKAKHEGKKEENVDDEDANRVLDSAVSSTKKIVGGLAKKFFPEESLFDVALDWIRTKSYVFIFDDLERCNCNLNEIFGFINGMVEHDGAKVIIVANEKEISSEIVPERIEQQYMVALNDGILWPAYEEKNRLKYLLDQRQQSSNKKLSLDELEYRRNELFSTAESNEDYKKIREKLIGVTLRFDADFSQIIDVLIDKTDYKEYVKDIIRRNTAFMRQRMDYLLHHNLRTIQFFLSRVNFLIGELNTLSLDSEYKEKIEDYVVQECFDFAAKYKSNYVAPKDDVAFLSYSSDKPLALSIKTYVESGEYDADSYIDEISGIDAFYMAHIDADDPYSKLYNNYYYLTQAECEACLEEMITKLERDRYPISIYVKIITLMSSLEEIGFKESFSRRVLSAMIKNLKACNYTGKITIDRFFFNEENVYKKAVSFSTEINEELKLHEDAYKRTSLHEMLLLDTWVDGLDAYVKSGNEGYIEDQPIFSLVEPSDWIKAITRSSSAVIHEFRRWMWSVYPRDFRRASFEVDWNTMKMIHDGIHAKEETDLIKRKALELVVWQIEETYKNNTGEEYKTQECD